MTTELDVAAGNFFHSSFFPGFELGSRCATKSQIVKYCTKPLKRQFYHYFAVTSFATCVSHNASQMMTIINQLRGNN